MHSHPSEFVGATTRSWVLILVVMEDALAPVNLLRESVLVTVLILVVMEDALAHTPVFEFSGDKGVLILVVMEDALAHSSKGQRNGTLCLNPCCNGRCTRTR